MKTTRMLVAAALAIAPFASAGAEEPLTKVLVPIFVREPLPGNFGSLWTTDFWISNSGPEPAATSGYAWDCSEIDCYAAPPIPARASFRPLVFPAPAGYQGSFVYLDPATADQVACGLRFRDLSRQDSSWGTQMPVPRAADFRTGTLRLVDVPLTEGFRQTLRIYELDGTPREARARVRLYGLDPSVVEPSETSADAKVGEFEVSLRFPAGTVSHPGYAEVSDLISRLTVPGIDRVRIEIEPVTDGLKLWAFATIIHNESQHATVVTP